MLDVDVDEWACVGVWTCGRVEVKVWLERECGAARSGTAPDWPGVVVPTSSSQVRTRHRQRLKLPSRLWLSC